MEAVTYGLAGLFLLAVILYFFRGEKLQAPSVPRAVYKIIPTSLCALLALSFAIRGSGNYAWLLFAGLVVCALADWLLEFRFLAGMGAFGCGHILYCLGYALAAPVTMRSLWVFLGLFGVVFLIWLRLRSKLDQAPLFLVYACVLCAMASLASGLTPLLMAGGLLFVVSDLMIGIRLAMNIRNKGYGVAIMVTYYAAQFLIAWSAGHLV